MLRDKESESLQYVAAIIGTITSIGYGSAMTWTSPAIPYLKSGKSHLPVTIEQCDRISSLYTVGLVIGYILNPFLIDNLGRKRTLLIYALPQTTSWLLIFLAKNVVTIYVARVSAGIGYGGGICALTIYLSEISNAKTREIFIALLNFSMGLGFFLVMLLGAYLPYNLMNLILLAAPIIFVATFSFVPDSPYFMQEVVQEDQEMEVILNNPENPEKEKLGFLEKDDLILKKGSNSRESLNSKQKSNFRGGVESREDAKEKDDIDLKEDKGNSCFSYVKKSRFWKLLTVPNNQKALLIVVALGAQDAFCGHTILRAYTQQLLTHKGSILAPEEGTLLISSMKTVATVISLRIVGTMRRRTLFLSTGMISTIVMGLLGAFFYLEEINLDMSFFGWFPLLGMCIFELSLSIGSDILFYLYQAELFSSEVKSIAIMICKVSFMAFSYLCLFRFQVFLQAVGKSMVFFMFTASAGLGTVCIFYITPETKGRSIDEIQTILRKKKLFF